MYNAESSMFVCNLASVDMSR